MVGKSTTSREAASSQGRRSRCRERPRAGASVSRATNTRNGTGSPQLPTPPPPHLQPSTLCSKLPLVSPRAGSLGLTDGGGAGSRARRKGHPPCTVAGPSLWPSDLDTLSCPVAFCVLGSGVSEGSQGECDGWGLSRPLPLWYLPLDWPLINSTAPETVCTSGLCP